MFSPDRYSFSRSFVVKGLFTLSALLTCVISLSGAACTPTDPLSALASMAGFSQEELDALNERTEQFSERVAALPSVAVRIVNNTDVIAEIELVAGLDQGELSDEFFGTFSVSYGGPFGFTSIDSKTVAVLPGGEATGSITCGELIGISINAPYAVESFEYYDPYYDDNADFGLGIAPGNVQISGLGVADDAFSGDLVALGRFVRPAQDGLDCLTSTLVIQIDTPAAAADAPDESDASPTHGTASLSIE